MSDTSGAITLPVAIPLSGEPASDPVLGTLLSYLMAVLEADVGDVWRRLEAGSPGPAAFGYPHNPTSSSFSERNLPALYMWRDGVPEVRQTTQDWDTSVSTIKALWIMPSASDEQAREREPILNGVSTAVRRAISRGRHPAWVVPGDDYYDPDEFGSSLAHQTGHVDLRYKLGVRTRVRIEDYDGKSVSEFDAIELQLSLTERTDYDATLGGDPATDLRGTVTTGGTSADGAVVGALTVDTFQFHPVLSAVTPATGPQAGGTSVILTGTQLGTVTEVTIGGVACTGVTVIDECTVLAVTGAHAAGAVAAVATQASGASASLAAAFTYV